MNKIRASYLLLLAAILSFLVAVAMLFFAATDSKNAIGFLAVAIFFTLTGAFEVYRFVKERKAL